MTSAFYSCGKRVCAVGEVSTIVSAALQQLDTTLDSLITEMITTSAGEFTAKKVWHLLQPSLSPALAPLGGWNLQIPSFSLSLSLSL